MFPKAHLRLLFAAVTLLPASSAAQTAQVTPPPAVTADNEAWFVAAGPILHAGSLYHPAGPSVYFNPREMVSSGYFGGIPLYKRTTIEPYSIVFVPVAGGLMQPYERRRDGELAGTTGSTLPSFPGTVASEGMMFEDIPAAPVGTTGTLDENDGALSDETPTALGAPTALPARTRRTRPGVDGLFLDYDGRRWFSDGPALRYDASRFRQVGEHRGFSVFTERIRPTGRIYIAVAQAADALVAPYTVRR